MRFFLIDKILTWHVGSHAEALKNVALSEDFFDDHFPRHPVMPGVLILEGMAQLAGLLLEASLHARFAQDAKAVLTVLERSKFRDMVRPGDTLRYRADVISVNEDGGKVSVEASRDERVVATSGMTFAFMRVADPGLDEKRRALLRLWLPEAAP